MFNLQPCYQHWTFVVPERMHREVGHYKETRESVQRRTAGAAKALESAVETYLAMARERPELGDNSMFGRDAVDTLRQYIGCTLMNWQMLLLHERYLDSDRDGFARGKQRMLELLKQQEKLVGSVPFYRIEDRARDYQSSGRPQSREEIRKTMRINVVHPEPRHLDYPGKDMYEAIKFYYGPRLKWALDMTEERLKAGKSAPIYGEIHGDCIARRRAWVDEGYDPARATPYEGETLEAVEEVYRAVRGMDGVQRLRETLDLP